MVEVLPGLKVKYASFSTLYIRPPYSHHSLDVLQADQVLSYMRKVSVSKTITNLDCNSQTFRNISEKILVGLLCVHCGIMNRVPICII